ncbi:MAG: hypothetical protein RL148_1420 [Planctomycetota bacterium]
MTRRITGSHVYAHLKCPRMAALDLTRPRDERRAPTPWEEFSLQRGRDFEAAYVRDLEGLVEPQYPPREFEQGLAATLELMRAGVPWIFQGVLLRGDRLGLPDLMRRVEGESALGAHHYEVVDVKSSGRMRSDQVLQVVFYSRLLEQLQGRMPVHGAIVLKDRSEQRFVVADFVDACREVELDLERARETPDSVLPFHQSSCEGCHWNHRCVPAMERAEDLSLLDGMSRGARATLQRLGVQTVAELAGFEPRGEQARGHLQSSLLNRLRKAAQARLDGRFVRDGAPATKGLRPSVFVHLLCDPYADRVLWMGALAAGSETVRETMPANGSEEWPMLQDLLQSVPRGAHILHFGGELPRVHERLAHRVHASSAHESRFVDLARRLRGAALYPGHAHSLAELVRHGLGRDPHREGHAGACALWLTQPDGVERVACKGRSDLRDLADLTDLVLPQEVELAADA